MLTILPGYFTRQKHETRASALQSRRCSPYERHLLELGPCPVETALIRENSTRSQEAAPWVESL
jgi:hypothetical protein